jgi:hypothetical protein
VCLSAHSASDSKISTAQTYFQDICIEYVPQNPALVTAASSLTATATVAGLVITINVYTTVIIPGTQSNRPVSTTTTISSTVTVPQVVLTAVTASVGLYQRTQAPLTTTAAAAIATTIATITPPYSAANSTSTATAGPPKFTGAALQSSVAFSVVGAVLVFSFFAM